MHTEEFLTKFCHREDADKRKLRYRPDQYLYLEGDLARSVFRITAGVVIVFRLLADGRRQIHRFATRGDFLALDFADAYSHNAEAITEVTAEVYDRPWFDRTFQNHPDFRRAVLRHLTEALTAAQEQAVMLGRKTALERTASFICFLLQKAPADARHSYIIIRMSRSDIADYLGLTFETVSRMLHRLKSLGVIDLPKPDRFKVLNGPMLAQLAGEAETLGTQMPGAVEALGAGCIHGWVATSCRICRTTAPTSPLASRTCHSSPRLHGSTWPIATLTSASDASFPRPDIRARRVASGRRSQKA